MIGDDMMEVERVQIGLVLRDIAPLMRESVARLRAIFDKARYSRATVLAPWTPEIARKFRLSLSSDATWRAVRDMWATTISPRLASHIRASLQVGALETSRIVTEKIERVNGVDVDWTIPRSELAEIGRTDVQGFSHREHARAILTKMGAALNASLRHAARTQGSLNKARSQFNRQSKQAVDEALRSVERVIGDAVTDGQRAALGQLNSAKMKMA